MCPSHNQIPHTDFERVDGWLTSNGAVHGTVLEYSCQVSRAAMELSRICLSFLIEYYIGIYNAYDSEM